MTRHQLKKHYAPAGTPVRIADIAVGAVSACMFSRPSLALARELCLLTESKKCFLLSSGRAAMALLMSIVRELDASDDRDEVIVPGYTCYSVPASIKRAGMKVRLCDVDPHTLSLDMQFLAEMDLRRVRAMVTANLYGIPNELTELESFAQEQDIILIDDAAQALGARIGGRTVGSFGAAGVFSFDKGKNITTIQGGAALARNRHMGDKLEERYEKLPLTNATTTAALLFKLATYSLALRPTVYEYVRRIGALGLGQTVYDDEFPIRKYSNSLCGIGLELLRRLDQLTSARVINAFRIQDALSTLPGIRLVEISESVQPAFTRYPVFIDDPIKRINIIETLQRIGIGATGSYPQALCDVPEVARDLSGADLELSGAREVARSIVTLPTHAYCPLDIGDQIFNAARGLLID